MKISKFVQDPKINNENPFCEDFVQWEPPPFEKRVRGRKKEITRDEPVGNFTGFRNQKGGRLI